MPLYTFLEEYDFSGKTIIPFTTHGRSGFSGTIETIGQMQPDATVIEDGLSISRNAVPEAAEEVADWVRMIKEVLPLMRGQESEVIVNISSIAVEVMEDSLERRKKEFEKWKAAGQKTDFGNAL